MQRFAVLRVAVAADHEKRPRRDRLRGDPLVKIARDREEPVGQRRGLGIAAETPLYVCGIDVPNNEVVLGRNDDLFSTELDASGCNWISGDVPDAPLRVTARIRYRQPEQPCTVTATGPDTVHVSFETPQRAITRGQAVVFYEGDTVLGGGTID